jgi:hypothetical protein
MKLSTLIFTLLVSIAVLGSTVLCQEAATETTTKGATTEESASALDVNGETTKEEGAAEAEQPVSEPVEQVPDSKSESAEQEATKSEPVQAGPLIDLFGAQLLSFHLSDDGQSGQIGAEYTNEALAGKKVIGVYFSADW